MIIIQFNKRNIYKTNETPIYKAIENRHAANQVELLLLKGADPTAPLYGGWGYDFDFLNVFS